MDKSEFIRVYNEPRNGCDHRVRHPLFRYLVYTDGVQELAIVGCYWLLDMIGGEVIPAFIKHRGQLDGLGFLYVVVNDKEEAILRLKRDVQDTPLWVQHIAFTDMPGGEWVFWIGDEGREFIVSLPTEN